MDKSIVQRVFEYVASLGREVSTREVLAAFSEAKPSAVTFSLSRLSRSGELKRNAHGRYTLADRSEQLESTPVLEDPYLMHILERVRPVLEFADLAYLYAVLEVARHQLPEQLAKLAKARAENITRAKS